MIGHREDPCYGISLSNLRTIPEGQNVSKKLFAFVFTGQGAQWPQMGRQLMKKYPTYRLMIDQLDAHLAQLSNPPSWTLRGNTERKSLLNNQVAHNVYNR